MTLPDVKKMKLMVVDDEPDNLDLLYRTFRRDFQVYKAHDALSALQILDKEGEMAVIISDQRMPEMNGTEFLSLTVERFPDTIRILLTGFTDVEDLVAAINSGQVFKYITKPWSPEKLKTLVEQATDIYCLVKKRTRQLSRALRRESLFNAVTTAIRESLDYDSMLQKIASTIGETFSTTCCLLRPVERDRLTEDEFCYQTSNTSLSDIAYDPSPLIEKVLQTRHYQLAQDSNDGKHCQQMVLPLSYQQHLLAILAIYQWGEDQLWQDEEIKLMLDVSEQAALALSQAKLYQRLQEKQAQLKTELEVARQIQTNLLRQTLPDITGGKVQACCNPAREVGGDFFEVFVHPKGDLWLAVGDVSGKGVPAALFMASAISVLRRELAHETPADPNVVLHNLNNALGDDLIRNNCFITLVLARYTPTTKELVYANAGHIYPLLCSYQTTVAVHPDYLKVRGIPLGILPKWQAEAGRLVLASGDLLLLASDGITEAMVSNQLLNYETIEDDGQLIRRSMLNQEGLWQILQREPQPLSLENLLARIQADNHVQEDDQTILSLEVF